MIDVIKKFFSAAPVAADTGTKDTTHDVRVATCALFLEMAEIDKAFSRDECDHVIVLLRDQYNLSDEHAEEMARAAHAELKNSLDLWRFANLINENYTREEKLEIVELIWRLVYADGHLSEHEQYLVTKLRKMLRITHRELIDAKLKVLHEMKQDEQD